MTGVLNAMAGASATSRHVVTLGWSGLAGDPVGFSIPSVSNIGSITPGTLRGVEIRGIYSDTSADLEFWLTGDFPQSHFYSITIEAGNGVSRTYTSASVDLYQNNATQTVWRWGAGDNRVWEEADNTEQHWFIIRF